MWPLDSEEASQLKEGSEKRKWLSLRLKTTNETQYAFIKNKDLQVKNSPWFGDSVSSFFCSLVLQSGG